MAEKPANRGTETVPAATETAVELPDYFDIGKAAAVVGADKAQSFYDEVMFVAVGNMSGHGANGVSLKALQIDAGDPHNSQRAIAQQALKKVERVFGEALKAKRQE